MALNNSSPSYRLGYSGRQLLRTLFKGGVLLITLGVVAVIAWVAYQLTCFYREQRAAVGLQSRGIPGALVGGATAGECPYLALSELTYGRLYVPVTFASIWRASGDDQLDQETWNHLRAFRYLRELEIHGCGHDPKLVADFSVITDLQYVLISETYFSEKEIGTLAALPRLEEAVFERKDGIDEWLPAIGQLRHLRSLEIRGDVSDRAATALASLPSLESLILESDRLTPSAVVILVKLKHLKCLGLSGKWINDKGLRELTKLKGLRELHLVKNDVITDQGVRFLAGLSQLEFLTLESKHITSRSVEALLRLKKLKYLDLSNTRIDNAGFRRLSEHGTLEVLKLRGTAITSPGTDIHFPSLGYLDLSNTSLNDEGLKHIAQSPKLRCLVIFDTQVTNASIDTLAHMPSLMEVYANGSQIDEKSVQWLQLAKILESRRAAEVAAVAQECPVP